MIYVILTGLIVVAILVHIVLYNVGEIGRLGELIKDLEKKHIEEKKEVHLSSKFRSSAVSFGKCIEQFVPFMTDFPVPVEDVHFLGMPIDFIAFCKTDKVEECEVHFIEVKSGGSMLSKKQFNIKTAILEGRVKWHEVRVAGVPKEILQ